MASPSVDIDFDVNMNLNPTVDVILDEDHPRPRPAETARSGLSETGDTAEILRLDVRTRSGNRRSTSSSSV